MKRMYVLVVLIGYLSHVLAQGCDFEKETNTTDCSSKSLTKVPADINNATIQLLLHANDLSSIAGDSFANLTQLDVLNLAHNMIETLAPNAFHGLKKLTHLRLNNNQLSSVADCFTEDLANLQTLRLEYNILTSVGHSDFANLLALIHLDLSHNKITSIESSSFDALLHLTELYLQSNQLKQVDGKLFAGKMFQVIDVSDNSGVCSCALLKSLGNSLSANVTCSTKLSLVNVTQEDGSPCQVPATITTASEAALPTTTKPTAKAPTTKAPATKAPTTKGSITAVLSAASSSTQSQSSTDATTLKSDITVGVSSSESPKTAASQTSATTANKLTKDSKSSSHVTTTPKSATKTSANTLGSGSSPARTEACKNCPTTKTITTKSPTTSEDSTTTQKHATAPKKVAVALGKTYLAPCSAPSSDTKITWTVNGTELKMTKKNKKLYSFTEKGLKIQNFTHTAAGNYCCKIGDRKNDCFVVKLKKPKVGAGTSPAVFVAVAILILFVLTVVGFLLYRKCRRSTAERYGLLRDQNIFRPVLEVGSSGQQSDDYL